MSLSGKVTIHSDLNNTEASRQTKEFPPDAAYAGRSLAIPESEDDPTIRAKYRPFLQPDSIARSDWVANLELSTALKMVEADWKQTGDRLKILILYGSLRERSYSKLVAFEQARILFRLGCDVRVYDPAGLPMKDDIQHDHFKVQELRHLSKWSDGHLWVSPEQHGIISGSVRPTQGRTLAIAQVSGGSQSFNTVNALRVLGRWMRMFVIPNQSSIPKAYTQFTDPTNSATGEVDVAAEGGSRLRPSGNRDRIVDCMEELVKYTLIMRHHFDLFNDRFSERAERQANYDRSATNKAEQAQAGGEGNVKTVGSADVVNGIDVAGI